MIGNSIPLKFEYYLYKFMQRIQVLCLDGNLVRIEKTTSIIPLIT
jgi:hypothetical protein